ncbi:MAG: type IX secretion system membrane protein PorP/SprF [Balneolaceae bacterium]
MRITEFFVISTLIGLLLLPSTLLGQSSNDLARSGSFYSGFGFGAPHDVNSTATNGMGLSGVSTFATFSSSISNPAHWGFLSLTQGNVSVYSNRFDASDNFSSAKSTKIGFDNFQFAVPILRERFGASFSISPLARADFNRSSFGIIERGELLLPSEFQTSTTGTGGINRFELGFGYRINRNISVGYAASIYLMSNNLSSLTQFDNVQLSPTTIDEKITGNGFGNRFGLYFDVPEFLRSNDQFRAGLTVSLPVSMTADREITTFRTIGNLSERIVLNEGAPNRKADVDFPLEINGGVTYYLNRFNSFSAEGLYQNWDEAAYGFDLVQESYFNDRFKVGVGYQHHAYLKQSGGFFSTFRYSLGATYDSGHLNIAGNEIDTAMLHAGILIPSQRTRSSIDLSINYGVRGTQSSDLVKENVWGFKLSINLAEFMFIRSRFQ